MVFALDKNETPYTVNQCPRFVEVYGHLDISTTLGPLIQVRNDRSIQVRSESSQKHPTLPDLGVWYLFTPLPVSNPCLVIRPVDPFSAYPPVLNLRNIPYLLSLREDYIS